MKKEKIVLLGGGHGLSAVLKAFIDDKFETSIIVSTTDDGGHTGMIRSEFDVPALGDIRRCLASLIEDSTLSYLLDYRFENIHNIKDVSLGNLILLSLLNNTDLESSMLNLKKTYNLKATLLPSINYSTDIYAKYDDKSIIKGESNIPSKKRITDIYYSERISITDNVKNAIKNADYIVISPGSLYTSILPILAIEEIRKLIKKSKAKLIYISNMMTQNKETDNYSILDTIKVIEKKLNRKIDTILSSSSIIDNEKREKYSYELSFPIKQSDDKRIIYTPLLDETSSQVRHDYRKVKQVIKDIIKEG